MGLMDKVKAQAEQAMAKAQQGVQQGQSKLEEMQAKKHAEMLLRNLGAAYYAQQRAGGSADAVIAALNAVDAHAAAHGSIDTSIIVPSQTPPPAGGSAAEGTSYNLDDV